MDLAGKIRQLRKQADISQAEFAERVDMSQRSVAAWESGDRLPTIPMLCTIADLFHVSVDYLLGLTEIPNAYLDTKKEPAPEEREQAQAAAAAALDGEDDTAGVTLTKADRQWIRSIVNTAVDQALARRGLPPDDPAGSPGRPSRPRGSG